MKTPITFVILDTQTNIVKTKRKAGKKKRPICREDGKEWITGREEQEEIAMREENMEESQENENETNLQGVKDMRNKFIPALEDQLIVIDGHHIKKDTKQHLYKLHTQILF